MPLVCWPLGWPPPRQRLEKVVASDLDVARDEIRDRGVIPPKHHILAGRLQVVVDNLEGPGPVPAHDRRSIVVTIMKFREVGVDDRSSGAVHRDRAPHVIRGGAM